MSTAEVKAKAARYVKIVAWYDVAEALASACQPAHAPLRPAPGAR